MRLNATECSDGEINGRYDAYLGLTTSPERLRPSGRGWEEKGNRSATALAFCLM